MHTPHRTTATHRNTLPALAAASLLALALALPSAPARAQPAPDAPAAPAFTDQPSSRNDDEGSDAYFSATVTGNPSPDLQWQVSTDGGITWTDLDAKTPAELTTTKVAKTATDGSKWTTTTSETRSELRLQKLTAAMDGTQYRCIARNTVRATASVTATLTVRKNTNNTPGESPRGGPANG